MQEAQGMWVGFLGQEDPLEEEMVTHSSILAWKTAWTEESGKLQSMCHFVTAALETKINNMYYLIQ